MNQYLTMFIDESKEHLQEMNKNLLNLEQNPQNIEFVQNIFRSAHTLKGMSATMGFADLAQLTHEMENILDLVRNLKIQMTSEICDVLFQSLDELELMVANIVQGGSGEADVSDVVRRLHMIANQSDDLADQPKGGNDHVSVALAQELDQYQISIIEQCFELGHHAYFLQVKLREDCVLKAARAYLVFDLLERNGEIVHSNPSVEDLELEKFEHDFSIYFISETEQTDLDQAISQISEIESVKVVALTPGHLESTVLLGKQENVTTPKSPEGTKAAAETAHTQGAGRTIRVEIGRLDQLMNLFSELLIDRVRLEQLAYEIDRVELSETVEHMANVTNNLQDVVLKLRMVPIDVVFNRFPRMIRDVARSLDKKINLFITGAETELDRTVVDEIGDPLVHLLRNAADHGLENTANRKAAGKDETGSIHLRAFQSGNYICIEIEDDGCGISRDKVVAKAIANEIITPQQAEQMADKEVYELLFAAGFSTVDQVSDLSGRGVGLDVVKTKITALGGFIDVNSVSGVGTKFTVQLPLTLSIITALLVQVGEEIYAISLTTIVETMTLNDKDIRHVHGNRMIDYRNRMIPLLSLKKLFEVPNHTEKHSHSLELLIIRKGDKLAAIEVDSFIVQQEVVLKSLGNYLNHLFAISGATILGNGHVALIIDTNALIK